MTPHACPVCRGVGALWGYANVVGPPQRCHACGGAGVLWGPPPEPSSPSTVPVPRAEWEVLVEAVRAGEEARLGTPALHYPGPGANDARLRLEDAARALVAAVGGREAP